MGVFKIFCVCLGDYVRACLLQYFVCNLVYLLARSSSASILLDNGLDDAPILVMANKTDLEVFVCVLYARVHPFAVALHAPLTFNYTRTECVRLRAIQLPTPPRNHTHARIMKIPMHHTSIPTDIACPQAHRIPHPHLHPHLHLHPHPHPHLHHAAPTHAAPTHTRPHPLPNPQSCRTHHTFIYCFHYYYYYYLNYYYYDYY